MFFYIAVFLMLIIFYLISLDDTVPILYYGICVVILISIAGLRKPGVDADMETYKQFYNSIDSIGFFQVEPTFKWIVLFVRYIFDTPTYLFLIYAILGVCIKTYAFKSLSEFFFLSLIVYYSFYFLLHEMTQIRVGVASGIFLLSIKDLYNKSYPGYIIKICFAGLFHYSAFVFLPLIFLNTQEIKPIIWYVLLGVAYLFFFLRIGIVDLVAFLPIPIIQEKISAYRLLLDQNIHSDISIYNPIILYKVAFSVFCLYNWKKLQQFNPYSIILIKIFLLSNIIFVLFTELPVLSGRLSQLYGISEIILLPFVFYIFESKIFSLLYILFISFLLLAIRLYYTNLLKPYF